MLSSALTLPSLQSLPFGLHLSKPLSLAALFLTVPTECSARQTKGVVSLKCFGTLDAYLGSLNPE